MRWASGEVIEYRHVKGTRPWASTPVRVVRDDDDVTVLWWTAGTRRQLPRYGDRWELLRLLADRTWELEEAEWWGGDVLLIIPSGAPFSLWPFRTAEGAHVAWYGNLQRPLARTDRGFETDDWTLDVVAAPDLSTWRWKDEDELLEGERVGLYSPDDVRSIRAAGARVVALIEGRDPVFDNWAEWRAEEDWAVPSFT